MLVETPLRNSINKVRSVFLLLQSLNGWLFIEPLWPVTGVGSVGTHLSRSIKQSDIEKNNKRAQRDQNGLGGLTRSTSKADSLLALRRNEEQGGTESKGHWSSKFRLGNKLLSCLLLVKLQLAGDATWPFRLTWNLSRWVSTFCVSDLRCIHGGFLEIQLVHHLLLESHQVPMETQKWEENHIFVVFEDIQRRS